MNFEQNNEKNKEIKLNPRFYSNDAYKTLINQGFAVHWMAEDEENEKSIFSVITDKNG